ncbi:ADP-ribosylglycohydrolase family protein [Escherichia coli]
MPSKNAPPPSAPHWQRRLEIALKIVRNADGAESASEQLCQVVAHGTSTIESIPCAIALVELAQTDPIAAPSCALSLGGDADTIGAMATAICQRVPWRSAMNPALKAETGCGKSA